MNAIRHFIRDLVRDLHEQVLNESDDELEVPMGIATSLEQVPQGVDIARANINPAVGVRIVKANDWLFDNRFKIVGDVDRVFDEVGPWWGQGLIESEDDMFAMAAGVLSLLEKDLADIDKANIEYPYRTALFLIGWQNGDQSPLTALVDTVDSTHDLLKSIGESMGLSYDDPRARDIKPEDIPFSGGEMPAESDEFGSIDPTTGRLTLPKKRELTGEDYLWIAGKGGALVALTTLGPKVIPWVAKKVATSTLVKSVPLIGSEFWTAVTKSGMLRATEDAVAPEFRLAYQEALEAGEAGPIEAWWRGNGWNLGKGFKYRDLNVSALRSIVASLNATKKQAVALVDKILAEGEFNLARSGTSAAQAKVLKLSDPPSGVTAVDDVSAGIKGKLEQVKKLFEDDELKFEVARVLTRRLAEREMPLTKESIEKLLSEGGGYSAILAGTAFAEKGAILDTLMGNPMSVLSGIEGFSITAQGATAASITGLGAQAKQLSKPIVELTAEMLPVTSGRVAGYEGGLATDASGKAIRPSWWEKRIDPMNLTTAPPRRSFPAMPFVSTNPTAWGFWARKAADPFFYAGRLLKWAAVTYLGASTVLGFDSDDEVLDSKAARAFLQDATIRRQAFLSSALLDTDLDLVPSAAGVGGTDIKIGNANSILKGALATPPGETVSSTEIENALALYQNVIDEWREAGNEVPAFAGLLDAAGVKAGEIKTKREVAAKAEKAAKDAAKAKAEAEAAARASMGSGGQ